MVALIPGSYDPITQGHVNIIERAARIADRVYVAVMNNDSAKHSSVLSSKTYMFSMEKRVELAKLSLSHIENIEVVSSCGMLIDLFDELSADVIIKGIRTSSDLEYEMIHAKWNKEHNPRLETLFLPADDSLASVSSTLVREYVIKGEFELLEGIISPKAIEYLQNVK
ncbi:MAG: pantetheine-phosphate adenylyltransferase [Eubacteriales bacterium]